MPPALSRRVQQGRARCAESSSCSLAGTVDTQCGRCKQVFYCGKACQVEHWKRGGHKQACKEPMACCICLDNDGPPLPIQGDCGCREETGCAAHVVQGRAYTAPGPRLPRLPRGLVYVPDLQAELYGCDEAWSGGALWARLTSRPAEDDRRLCAQNNLADVYVHAGRLAATEALYRDALATRWRVHGPNHESTLVTAGNVGVALVGGWARASIATPRPCSATP